SGMLAGEDMQALIASISQGEEINDTELLARLVSLLAPILTAPFGTPEQLDVIERVLQLDSTTASASAETPASPGHELPPRSISPEWLSEGELAS
ncbi:MAG: TetR/AcrR family transcriptional regulator, partial [Chloroflexota bacterium]